MNNKQEIKQDTVEQDNEKEVSLENNQEFYSGFSPLDEAVKERAYTKSNIDSNGLEAELEEPSFDAPNFSDFDNEDKEPSTFNPSMENLDKKEQMYATEQMVDTFLDVYGKAHMLANGATKIKEEKISKAIEDGEIDSDLQIPIDNLGNTIGLIDYVQEYNSQLSDAIKLEEDFVEKVKPPMVRVFQKKGLAMTDEQFLVVAFGTDLLTKGAMVFQLVKQNKKLMDMWKGQSNLTPKSKKSNQSAPSAPQSESKQSTVQPSSPKPTEQQSVFYEPEEFTAESMVNNMMGMSENVSFQNSPQSDSMPKFGDPTILKKLDELSKKESKNQITDVRPKEEDTKKRKRGRPKKER